MSGRPQIVHVPAAGSRSIAVNASALFKSEPVRSMPFSITPVSFEWFPEGAWIVALHGFIEVSVGIIVDAV